jgi:1-acyl-sn-glycerol-3-phosphate acyltransferase
MRSRAALIVGSAAYNLAFYLSLIVLMIVGLPALLFGRHGVFLMARTWGEWSVIMLRWLCGLRVEYRGLENIPQGGYIIAAKHESFLETFALLRHSPDFAIILKKSLTFIPLFGWYLIVSRQIAIDRARGHSALSQIVSKSGEVLRAGRQVYIYPEGTRRAPGAPPAYKFGVAAIYAGNESPCLPVALNTGLFWGRRGFLRRPGVAVIEYLPPIPPGLPRDLFAKTLEERIEAACERLYAEAVAADPSLAPVLQAGRGWVDEKRELAKRGA